MSDSTDNARGPFRFDRYINGRPMAEGVQINKERNLEDAMVSAAKIASRGPKGEVPVLIYRADLAPTPPDPRVKALVEALRFYAWENEARLPSEGPWGAASTDFGQVARAALALIDKDATP